MSKTMTDRDGRTELHHAIIDGQLEQVRSLLDGGADANAHDKTGWTSLHFAAQRFALEIATLLIQHGADVEAQDAYGGTPLFRAVFESRGRGEMIDLLRRAGADSKRQNSRGVSPLSLARTIGNYDVAQFFSDLT
jgi:ankyrin repeat protein